MYPKSHNGKKNSFVSENIESLLMYLRLHVTEHHLLMFDQSKQTRITSNTTQITSHQVPVTDQSKETKRKE